MQPQLSEALLICRMRGNEIDSVSRFSWKCFVIAWERWPVNIYFINTGKTPAKNVRLSCHIDPMASESELNFDRGAPEGTPAIIAPNDGTTYCGGTPLKIPTVTQEVLDIFSSKEKILFAHGTVLYDDIFGKKH